MNPNELLGKSVKYDIVNPRSKRLTFSLKGKFIKIDKENKQSVFVNTLGRIHMCYVVFVTSNQKVDYLSSSNTYYINIKQIKPTRLPKSVSLQIDTLQKQSKSKINPPIQHSYLSGELFEELMFGECMSFAIYLNSHLPSDFGGVVAYVEREYANFKDDSKGYVIEKGLVVHVAYKLKNGTIIDALNKYETNKDFIAYVEKEYDIICDQSYFEPNSDIVERYYPYIKKNNYRLSQKAIAHGKEVISKLTNN